MEVKRHLRAALGHLRLVEKFIRSRAGVVGRCCVEPAKTGALLRRAADLGPLRSLAEERTRSPVRICSHRAVNAERSRRSRPKSGGAAREESSGLHLRRIRHIRRTISKRENLGGRPRFFHADHERRPVAAQPCLLIRRSWEEAPDARGLSAAPAGRVAEVAERRQPYAWALAEDKTAIPARCP